MMNNFFKQTCFLRTELLPQEIPLFFSNYPIIDNLNNILDKIPTIESQNNYTIPLNYQIPKNNTSARTISLLHPLSQIENMIYIMKYEFLILNHLKKSSFNIRKAIKFNNLTFNDQKNLHSKRLKLEQDYGIQKSGSTITNEDLDKVVKKYFAYSKHHRLLGIISNPSFIRSRNKYRYYLKLDIQNFFGSIYTHSLVWAIIGEKDFGKTLSNNKFSSTFASSTDRLLQKSNNNETNGMLLGPEINRIISDILLTTIDVDIKNDLIQFQHKKDYEIFRFIDDYFIFATSKEIVEEIEKTISKNLAKYNLTLNHSKKEIHETPYYIGEPAIDDTKIALEILNLHREKLLATKFKNVTVTEREFEHIVGKSGYWINFYHDFSRITTENKQSATTRKIVLYILKAIELDIDPTSLKKTNSFSYIKNLYTALEVLTAIYSTHLDFDTTHAYIRILLKIKNSLNVLEKDSGVNQEEVLNIENKIFEHIYRILKQNKHNLNNLTDLILFLESFKKKLSSQFLCEILELHSKDYFTICSVAHYIQDIQDIQDKKRKNNLNPRYKIVLKKLSSKLDSLISTPPNSMNGKSPLLDANYFYFLNDFSHYKLIEKNNNELYKKLKNKLDNQIKETGKLEPIFLDITRSSYFNWDLNKYDFELFIINKLLQQRENISSTY
ncbi:reverse transcriptase domain-containing protein [Streptococcus anginosus]|uniref:reverse transcriptase domain-containing protein n=1 Tax=Streptococcus anginosus TaxID=1328 RepID=UPI0022E4323F|nr:reverse transcriptase domain-containing protein [Streptococcus anginosus]